MPTVRKITPPEPGAGDVARTLSEADVRAWVGDTTVQRGRPYVRGALFNRRRVGAQLKADCQGSSSAPYRVTATLGDAGLVAADCSCPVGSGRCKHVAALLLAYSDDPASFAVVEETAAALERRSQPELVMLVKQMLARHPELEILLELPAPAPAGTRPALSAAQAQRQVRDMLNARGYDEWDEHEDAGRLDSVGTLAQSYAEAGDLRSATLLYATATRAALERYEELDDEDGAVGDLVNACVDGLGAGLARAAEPDLRAEILRELFYAYNWDIEFGGIGIAENAPDLIVAHATPAERASVARLVHEMLARVGPTASADYQRQQYQSWLLDLEGDTLDDESYLRVCRATGRYGDLVDRLLKLGRVDEAEAAARAIAVSEITHLADIFGEHGLGERGATLVRARLNDSGAQPPRHLLVWLRARAQERGDLAEALRLTEQMFWAQPWLETYQEVKSLAQQLERWEELRVTLLRKLKRDKHYNLLAEIYLRENRISDAVQIVPLMGDNVGYTDVALATRIARAAEQDYPRDAIHIYTREAERLIDGRSRDSYRAAADSLARVRDLRARLGEQDAWRKDIQALRDQHKRLRALQEELTKAGV